MKIKLNPDEKVVQEVRTALKKTGGYCPCALDKTEDTKCMCKDFRERVANNIPGECHCGLYVCVEEQK